MLETIQERALRVCRYCTELDIDAAALETSIDLNNCTAAPNPDTGLAE